MQTTGAPAPALSEIGTLPAGLALVDNGDGTATFSGTAQGTIGTSASSTATTLTSDAASASGTPVSQTFVLTVDDPAAVAPTYSSVSSTAFALGTPSAFTVATASVPAAALSENGMLPAGLTFIDNNDGTAGLSGTPLVYGRPYDHGR